MSCYQINGGAPLRGRLAVQGAKNSVLPILTAALLAPGESVIHNCPDLSDVTATLDILRLLGCGNRRRTDAAALAPLLPALATLRLFDAFLGATLSGLLLFRLRLRLIRLAALLLTGLASLLRRLLFFRLLGGFFRRFPFRSGNLADPGSIHRAAQGLVRLLPCLLQRRRTARPAVLFFHSLPQKFLLKS